MRRRYWTEQEIAKFEQLVETWPMLELAALLNRSEVSLYNKASELGYSLQPTLDNYSFQRLADALRCSRATVTRWVRRGYLRARKVSERRWAIRSEDFASFYQNYPEKLVPYDPEVIRWLIHAENW